MPPSLNNDILEDICKTVSYNEGLAGASKFALSGAGPLNAFMKLLTTVKSVEFKRDGVKAIYNWATYYLSFQSDYYSNGLCAKILSYASELTIFVDDLDSQHIDLFLGWNNKENLSKVCIAYAGRRHTFLKSVMLFVLSTPVKHLVADASSLIPFISTVKGKLFDSVEIHFENGYFFDLEELLTAFRFYSKNLTLSLGAEYTWKEILDVVTKTVKENDKGAVSTVVENLNLNLNGHIKMPALPELQLSDFFEDISKCFPMLKNVNFCVDFTSNAGRFSAKKDASIELYVSTCDEVVKQVSKAKIDYKLFVEWIREDQVFDISPTSAHFVAFCEVLTNDLGFHKIENKESCWEVEKNISENKNFKMAVALIQPIHVDYDIDTVQDDSLSFGDEEYPRDYDPDEDYDAYEDYDSDVYAEFHGDE
uniref:Uncharacterized protein n=1 Tax=Panagrolaimus sp. PS1159 TaxID=55785 RepID=A0AC35F7P4_9BILA